MWRSANVRFRPAGQLLVLAQAVGFARHFPELFKDLDLIAINSFDGDG